jgi:hypothetical protein
VLVLPLGALVADDVPLIVIVPLVGAVPVMLQVIEAPTAKLLTGGVGEQLDVKLPRLVFVAVQLAFAATLAPVFVQTSVPVTGAPL